MNLLPHNLTFAPSRIIIRQLLYTNIAGTDNGIYLIWSDITQSHIGAVYMGIQGVGLMPETIINLTSVHNQLTFTVTPANTAFTGPTGQLVMVLEFC